MIPFIYDCDCIFIPEFHAFDKFPLNIFFKIFIHFYGINGNRARIFWLLSRFNYNNAKKPFTIIRYIYSASVNKISFC